MTLIHSGLTVYKLKSIPAKGRLRRTSSADIHHVSPGRSYEYSYTLLQVLVRGVHVLPLLVCK